MAGQQRKCANCRFFSDAGMPGNGWCTHPKRQLSSGVKLLVRGGELACRNSWGGDLFQSRLDEDTAQVAAADLPGNDQEDEVTSVTIPSNRPEPAEDRVVRDRPAPQRQAASDTNDAAHRDQDERARIMARGSRDALAHARRRFSTRNQPAPKDDVVADDDTISTDTGDRVITRQERFSDRDFAAGLPPMRTPPVPREEIHQQTIASQDRFDTVPAIDPDFDIPAQRSRAEARSSPAPEPPPEPEAEPNRDDQQFTTYEHVLHRARRIRAAKQERTRPIRHADLLLHRDAAASRDISDPYGPANDGAVEDWRVESDEASSPAPEPHVAHADHVERWQDSDEESLEMWAEEDEDPLVEWSSEHDDDIAWDDEDEGYDHPKPRRAGWLSRFGLGRRSSEPTYDDAIITRHAARHDDLEDDLVDDVPFEDDRDWGYLEPDPDPTPAWDDPVDELPAWQAPARAHAYPYADEQPAAAPIPPPVPASERPAEAWDLPGMPVRPATPARVRQPFAGHLPDLDDTLFEDRDDRVYRAERLTARHPEPEPSESLGSTSPRDSYFRASRFPRPEPASARRDGSVQVELDQGSTLPDLDADHLDVRDIVARGAELIDRRIEVAPDIPRQCRTCRSFRSADGGTRGWCTNEWAFTHRRMVNDDDLACVSAIGCWWLPADHLRLDLDDAYDDVRTPRMDELIAGEKPAARRAAGE